MNNDWVYLVCPGIPVLLIGGSLVGLFVMAVIEMGQGDLPPNSLNISDDPTWWGEEIKMKKIAWCIPFILVTMLLSACFHNDSSDFEKVVPTLDRTYVYTDNHASVSKYGGAGPEDTADVQCPFTGKVVVTITPDNHTTVWVFGPDQINDKCEQVGDMELLRDDFSGTYIPKDQIVDISSCVSGHPGDIEIAVTNSSVSGHVSCLNKDVLGKNNVSWISATFDAKISK